MNETKRVKSDEERSDERLRAFAFWLILCSIPFAILFVILVTTYSLYPLNVNNFGDIGDAIGGITAPIFAFLGAVLVYLSFQAQIEANKTLKKEIENNKIVKEYELINTLTEQMILYFGKLQFEKNKEGVNSVAAFFLNYENIKSKNSDDALSFLRDYCYVLETIDLTSRKIYYFDFDDKRYKILIRSKFRNFYYIKVKPQIDQIKELKDFIDFLSCNDDLLQRDKSITANVVRKIKNIEETLQDDSKFWD